MWKAFGIGVVRVCSRFSFLYPPFLLEQTVPRKFFRYHSALELNVSHFFMNDI